MIAAPVPDITSMYKRGKREQRLLQEKQAREMGLGITVVLPSKKQLPQQANRLSGLPGFTKLLPRAVWYSLSLNVYETQGFTLETLSSILKTVESLEIIHFALCRLLPLNWMLVLHLKCSWNLLYLSSWNPLLGFAVKMFLRTISMHCSLLPKLSPRRLLGKHLLALGKVTCFLLSNTNNVKQGPSA